MLRQKPQVCPEAMCVLIHELLLKQVAEVMLAVDTRFSESRTFMYLLRSHALVVFQKYALHTGLEMPPPNNDYCACSTEDGTPSPEP